MADTKRQYQAGQRTPVMIEDIFLPPSKTFSTSRPATQGEIETMPPLERKKIEMQRLEQGVHVPQQSALPFNMFAAALQPGQAMPLPFQGTLDSIKGATDGAAGKIQPMPQAPTPPPAQDPAKDKMLKGLSMLSAMDPNGLGQYAGLIPMILGKA